MCISSNIGQLAWVLGLNLELVAGCTMRIHSLWVHRLDANAIVSRDNAPKYMLFMLTVQGAAVYSQVQVRGSALDGT